jgi:hypothetical protein
VPLFRIVPCPIVSEILDGNLAAPGQFGGIPFADEGDKLVKKAVLGLMLRYILLGKVAIFDIVGDEIKCDMDVPCGRSEPMSWGITSTP